jgi:hypothetical protein
MHVWCRVNGEDYDDIMPSDDELMSGGGDDDRVFRMLMESPEWVPAKLAKPAEPPHD